MNKKICIIGPCINMGGIERASSNFANYASSEGFEVIYLAIFKHPKFFKLHSSIIYDEPLNGENTSSINIFKTILRIRNRINFFKPDSILVFNKFYASLTLISLLGLDYKIFISERSSPLYKWKRKLKIINDLAFLINPPYGVIAQTKIAASYQKKKLSKGTKIKVIPNSLRDVKIYPHIKRKKIILAVGRLGDRLKGFDQLLEAFKLITNQKWKLVFAGGDEDGQFLKDRAKEIGVFERVRFLGKVLDIDRVYAEAGIFVIPSRSEGFPNALCEAMASGLPCISFDFISGPRDIINHEKNGIIVENSNIEALALAIDNLIKDEKTRFLLGRNAMKIRDELNEKLIGDQYLKFILT